MDYMLDIFRTLSIDVPEEMLYRETENGMELRTMDNCGDMDDSWEIISTRIAEAA